MNAYNTPGAASPNRAYVPGLINARMKPKAKKPKPKRKAP